MLDRQGSRFALEVLFLAALATGLALAELRPLEIVGVMAVGWVVVALLEWAAWRGEPHYGRGLPPRYYVPSTSLPPPQPLEQVYAGYPDPQRDEAPTWIASAEVRDRAARRVAGDRHSGRGRRLEPVVLPPPPAAVRPGPPVASPPQHHRHPGPCPCSPP